MDIIKRFLTFNIHGIDWGQLKTYDFWFGYDRSMLHVSDRLFADIGVLLVLLAIIAFVFSRFARNEFLAKVAKWKAKILLIIGLAEILWIVLRYEYVQVFSTRFVAALILLIGLVWLYFPASYFFSRYKVDLAEAERKANRDKYLNRSAK